ncbi:MAG: hypothetical protein C0603_03800 [Denitrovibrio sp.]|nr:MAG: hypothetical protein C0603_03800 [Denitrovibrio sp.]
MGNFPTKLKGIHIHRFQCTQCNRTISVNVAKATRGFTAICKNCGAEYPFTDSDARMLKKLKRHIK